MRNTARWFVARGNEIKNENVFCFFEQFHLYPVAERLVSRSPPLARFFVLQIIQPKSLPCARGDVVTCRDKRVVIM